jgi:hypothetical protein
MSVAPQDDVYCLEVPGYGWFFANNAAEAVRGIDEKPRVAVTE